MKKSPPHSKPHLIIVGAGFGGLYAAKALKRFKDVRITILDRNNYHLFQPLLYQVATAGLTAADIAEPIRNIIHNSKHIQILMAEVHRVILKEKCIQSSDEVIPYDYLILATGGKTDYFAHPEWEKYASGLKNLGDAYRIRNQILKAFENAERMGQSNDKRKWLDFYVIGGGPTGVELAGAIAEISRHTVAKDYLNFDPRKDTRIYMIEAGDRILSQFPETLSQKAEKQLRKLGVEVLKNSMVKDITEEGLWIQEEFFPSKTIIWAAGVKASSLTSSLDVPKQKNGQIIVETDLSIPKHPEVYVIGDAAYMSQKDGSPVPGVAPAAIQMGEHSAQNIKRRILNKSPLAFHYKDKGNLATIGRSKAIAHIGQLKIGGFVAWLLWLVIHVFFLIGFRNRLVVLFEWTRSYFTFKKSSRVIMPESE